MFFRGSSLSNFYRLDSYITSLFVLQDVLHDSNSDGSFRLYSLVDDGSLCGSLYEIVMLWLIVFFFWVAGDVGSVYFGPNHPMKPHRLCMTHHLILAYGLHSKMEVYVSLLLIFHVSCS